MTHNIRILKIFPAVFCSLALFLTGCTEEPDNDIKRPNIIVFLADDMGFSDLGSYGAEFIDTPHIDRLAAEGRRFTQFYNAARCSPTRASLLTGRYPHQSGMGWLAGPNVQSPGYLGHLNESKTIAEVLEKEGGYRTMMTGKWHVGSSQNDVMPWTRGFDRYFGRPIRADYWDSSDLILDGKPYEWTGDDFYMTDVVGEFAAKFIKTHFQDETDQPFFLYQAFYAPHWPLHAKDKDIERYRGKYMIGWDELRRRRYNNMVDKGIISGEQSLPPRDSAIPAWNSISKENQKAWDLKMSVYAAQITAMDRAIGRILDEVKKSGQEDNTLILFLSDNGASAEGIGLGESQIRNNEGTPPGGPNSHQAYLMPWAHVSSTPFRLYKHWVHEGGIATPLIARWPDVIKGKGSIADEPGHVMDIMATALDVADIEYPGESDDPSSKLIEGKSLLPIFQGKNREGHKRIFWEHEGHRAVREGKWKLVSAHEFDDRFYEKWGYPREINAEWELYDMTNDRFEQNNLADKYPEKRDELIAAYESWAEKAGVVDWDKIRPELPLFDE